jgi:hypothetical protein
MQGTKTRSKGRAWRVGCGGTEVPFTYGGRRYLYVFNGVKHGYLDMDTDVVYEDYRDGYREVVA